MYGAVGGPSPFHAGARGGHKAVWKCHAPGQRGWFAVIAVTGDEAADASDGITHGRSGAGKIKHGKCADTVAPRDDQQRSNAGDEASEPGKAAAKPIHQFAEML